MPRHYTVKSLAAELECSEPHIYNLCQSGKLRHIKWGKLIRIPHAAVDEYEEQQCQNFANTNGLQTGTSDVETDTDAIERFQLVQLTKSKQNQ